MTLRDRVQLQLSRSKQTSPLSFSHIGGASIRGARRTLEIHRCFYAICARCSSVKIIESEDVDVQPVAVV